MSNRTIAQRVLKQSYKEVTGFQFKTRREKLLDRLWRTNPILFNQLYAKYEGRGLSMILDLRENFPRVYNKVRSQL